MKKTIFTKGIFFLLAVLIATTVNAQKKPSAPPAKNNSDSHRNYIDIDENAATGESIINYKMGNEIYKFKMRANKITELYVDDKKIPETDYSKYEADINRIMEKIKKDRELAELDMIQARKEQDEVMNDQKQAMEQQQRSLVEQKKAMENQQLSLQDQKRAMEAQQLSMQKIKMAEMTKQQSASDRQLASDDQKKAELDRKKSDEDRERLNDMLTDLQNEKLINIESGVTSFTLNEKELMVNGKKQASSLHQKFKNKYLRAKEKEIKYNHTGTKSEFSVER